ncbi:hypothetical protein PV-S19_0353 [Pacmanvirus S19]|nr:hypothetical protein PV-S19_0353 [Pacmanvirus S19]
MEEVKTYEYRGRFITKDGEVKEYIKKCTRTINKEKKVTDKELLALIKEINDKDKRKQIKQFIENIKNM